MHVHSSCFYYPSSSHLPHLHYHDPARPSRTLRASPPNAQSVYTYLHIGTLYRRKPNQTKRIDSQRFSIIFVRILRSVGHHDIPSGLVDIRSSVLCGFLLLMGDVDSSKLMSHDHGEIKNAEEDNGEFGQQRRDSESTMG